MTTALAPSSVLWSFNYTATATGLATLDLEYILGADAINMTPARQRWCPR